MFLSPLSPVRPWADAHKRPDEFDQTRKARQMAAELWRKPETPVLDEEQISEIDRLVKAATA